MTSPLLPHYSRKGIWEGYGTQGSLLLLLLLLLLFLFLLLYCGYCVVGYVDVVGDGIFGKHNSKLVRMDIPQKITKVNTIIITIIVINYMVIVVVIVAVVVVVVVVVVNIHLYFTFSFILLFRQKKTIIDNQQHKKSKKYNKLYTLRKVLKFSFFLIKRASHDNQPLLKIYYEDHRRHHHDYQHCLRHPTTSKNNNDRPKNSNNHDKLYTHRKVFQWCFFSYKKQR